MHERVPRPLVVAQTCEIRRPFVPRPAIQPHSHLRFSDSQRVGKLPAGERVHGTSRHGLRAARHRTGPGADLVAGHRDALCGNSTDTHAVRFAARCGRGACAHSCMLRPQRVHHSPCGGAVIVRRLGGACASGHATRCRVAAGEPTQPRSATNCVPRSPLVPAPRQSAVVIGHAPVIGVLPAAGAARAEAIDA